MFFFWFVFFPVFSLIFWFHFAHTNGKSLLGLFDRKSGVHFGRFVHTIACFLLFGTYFIAKLCLWLHDIPSCTLHGCCYFLMGSGWLLLFPDGLWMVAVNSWWALDGCCLFLMGSGWLLLFPDGLWVVAVYSWWALDGCCLFLVGSGWLLLFPNGLWMVVVYS